jgi:hypothetical protein
MRSRWGETWHLLTGGRDISGKRWGARAVLLVVLALALFLRMGWPTLAEFKRDEATVVRRALAIAYEGDRPAVGVGASVGLANLPLCLYLVAVPLRLWPDPVAAVLFVGLLNGLAVLACYALGRAYFGRAVGWVASFLFAVSPWAVLYGRKIWSQNLPLVTLGFFAALFATFVRGRRWALVGAFVALAALIGLHLGGLAFAPVLLIAMLLYRKDVARWPLLLGILLLLLALSPYLIHDALDGWPNLRGFLGYAGGEARFSWDALRYAFMLSGGEGVQGMAGGRYQAYLAGLPDLWWLNWLVMGLMAMALLYGAVQVVKGPRKRCRSFLLLFLWLVIPVGMQSFPTTPVHPHYFILLYPVQFLFIAVFLVDVLGRVSISIRREAKRLIPIRREAKRLIPIRREAKRLIPIQREAKRLIPIRREAKRLIPIQREAKRLIPRSRLAIRGVAVLRLLLIGALVLWGGWQVAVMGRLLVFMERYPTTGGYGIPLKYPRLAAQEARRLAALSQPDTEIVVLSAGTDPAVDETPSVFEALLSGHPHRFADGRWALPVPDSAEAVYLVGPVQAGRHDDQEGSSSRFGPVLDRLEQMDCEPLDRNDVASVVSLPDGWQYRLFCRKGPDREDVLAGLTPFSEAVPLANGVTFLGYGMADRVPAGETLDVWLAWWVRSLPPHGTRYHFFTHLLDEEGGLRSQHDGIGFPAASWRVGDVVLSRFALPVPSGLSAGWYQVWAGMYTYPDVTNVPILDVAGNPAGDRVALGQVEVVHGK